ncbi:MAG: DUF2239 family protein [Deltaproteobacteria bacterium]|nr:DUF2239 family protein [Deltaproteobacteria bacterium]
MGEQNLKSCTAFKGDQRVASGNLLKVARKVKKIIDQDEQASILIFDNVTSELVEVDFRGTMKDVLENLEKPPVGVESANGLSYKDPSSQRKPGRPKLGVVSREVTLLPRHWDWLNSQPGGASVALRRLIEEARRENSGKDRVRHSQEVTYRFMSAMAGNFPGFEEATRALFAGDSERFNSLVAQWSVDIRDHARKLAEAAFQNRGD